MLPNTFLAGQGIITPPSPYYKVGEDCLLYHAYWSGDAKDHSGNGNDGTPHNSPVFGEQGVTLNGSNQYISGPTLDFDRTAFTHIYWYKMTQWDALHPYNSLNDAGQVYYNLNLYHAWWAEDNKHLFFAYYGGGGPSIDTLSVDNWYCVAAGRSGIGTNEAIIGVNGTWNTGTLTRVLNSSETVLVGGGTEAWFKGIIGEVLIFNTKKDDTFLTDYYNATKGRYGL